MGDQNGCLENEKYNWLSGQLAEMLRQNTTFTCLFTRVHCQALQIGPLAVVLIPPAPSNFSSPPLPSLAPLLHFSLSHPHVSLPPLPNTFHFPASPLQCDVAVPVFARSDVWAQLRPKAMAWAQPGGAHGLGDGQAEPKLSRRALPWLGPGLGHGFLEKVSKCCVLSWLTFTRRLNNIKSELGGTQTMVMARNK